MLIFKLIVRISIALLIINLILFSLNHFNKDGFLNGSILFSYFYLIFEFCFFLTKYKSSLKVQFWIGLVIIIIFAYFLNNLYDIFSQFIFSK